MIVIDWEEVVNEEIALFHKMLKIDLFWDKESRMEPLGEQKCGFQKSDFFYLPSNSGSKNQIFFICPQIGLDHLMKQTTSFSWRLSIICPFTIFSFSNHFRCLIKVQKLIELSIFFLIESPCKYHMEWRPSQMGFVWATSVKIRFNTTRRGTIFVPVLKLRVQRFWFCGLRMS